MTTTVTTPKAATAPAQPAPRVREVRWELAAALRHFGRLGYEFGFNGHVSARAPEAPGHFWVNPFGVSISTVTPADFVLVDETGTIVEPRGNHAINGFAGNLALHTAIPEAEAVVHLHTPRAFIFSNHGEPPAPVNTDSALVTDLVGVSSTIWGATTEPTNVDLAAQGKRVILQKGHGFTTWGSSVGEAAFLLEAAERAADANLVLRGLGAHDVLAPEVVARWTLTPELARAHFEPAFTIAEREGLR